MDITINPVSGSSQQYTPQAVKISTGSAASSAPQANAAAQPTASETVNAGSSTSDLSSQYEAALRQAALSFKNVYAVSDQDFSIFKDATGKYITRYVSLRDGKITYVPEPTLVKPLQLNAGSNTPTRVAISV